MTAELKQIQEKLSSMDNELFGAIIYEAVDAEDNYPIDMAKGICQAFARCQTDAEYQAADRVLIAISGYSIQTLIDHYEGIDSISDIF